MPVQDVNKISMLGLAHVGDAVYELLYRSKLCTDGHTAVAEMHRMTVAFVRAEAQAEAAANCCPCSPRRKRASISAAETPR